MSPALLNNPGPLMLGGKPASTAVNDVIPLASDLVDHLSRANPTLTSLQTEAVRRELIAVIVQGLQVGIQLLDHRKLPTDQDLDGIHTMTVQQALKGVPLSAILSLTNEGISTFRTLILSRADAGDSANLGDLNEFLFALAQRLHSFISISYLAALPAGSQLGEYSAGALVKAMLDGDDPTQLALQMGIELAPRYLVLRLMVNLPPTRTGARNGTHQRIHAYRDLTVVQAKIAAHFGSALLEAPAPQRGLVLIEGTPDWKSVCEIIQNARATVGVEITAIGESAAVGDIAAAQATTHELAQIVRRLRLPARSYRMEDLALEYQLTRSGAGRDSLINLLKPLHGNPELLQTLSIHLANGQHRQRTASALGLHTNTVDNRIKRIAALTGLDPALPSELLKLRAAMISLSFASTDVDNRPAKV
ncbi:helix-turn-helix domain-containing protein [Rhodococcus sp. IEGM 1409]|uniref:PucR family transcriptional regulator n=1 Tax=Rhodococcus sp. IEGM 1409 TaxID=3047082 RepID=UPI0024B66797|nr:helix-turn-helix domain-containing protein [Rhodococcus sp. IEGM 1409]MDI9900219.1 helix-turn-helix domain-containing protein [Rhodococcus sp. IEGM 1409]